MQPGRCFYLHSHLGQDTPVVWVLTSRDEAGTQTAAVEHKVLDDPAQHWYWNIKDGTLHNEAFPDLVLDAADGLNRVVLSKPNGNDSQKGWDYLATDRMVSGAGLPLKVNNVDWTVQTTTDYAALAQYWHIEYCFHERG